MKALIRHEDEIITEEDGIDWIDWITGMPLTNPDWCGGCFRLIEDFNPSQFDREESATISAKSAEIAELKARLASLESDL